jgi:acetyltransferase-like isoleucine patch superfamily enzyme
MKIGKNVRICSSVFMMGSGQLAIEDNTWIGHKAMIISTSSVKIGANVDIAPRVYIGTGSHEIDISGPRIAGKGTSQDIEIGDGVWIGAGAILLPGTKIAEKSIVAAGAVVKGNVPPYTLVGGIPAKVIKKLK